MMTHPAVTEKDTPVGTDNHQLDLYMNMLGIAKKKLSKLSRISTCSKMFVKKFEKID